jgi:hypothetical protein
MLTATPAQQSLAAQKAVRLLSFVTNIRAERQAFLGVTARPRHRGQEPRTAVNR